VVAATVAFRAQFWRHWSGERLQINKGLVILP